MIHTLLLQSEYSVYVYSCVAARWLRINHLIIICINFATEYKESRLLSSQQDIYLVLSTNNLLNHQRILPMYAACDKIGVIFVYFVTERKLINFKMGLVSFLVSNASSNWQTTVWNKSMHHCVSIMHHNAPKKYSIQFDFITHTIFKCVLGKRSSSSIRSVYLWTI